MNQGLLIGATRPALAKAAGIIYGSTATTISANLILAATSTQEQIVTPTAAGLSVWLVPGNTAPIAGGGPLTIVTNAGLYILAVRDGAGNIVAWVGPGQTCAFYLQSNATIAGAWTALGQTALNLNVGPTTSSGIPSNPYVPSVIFLTRNTGVIVHYKAGKVYGLPFSISVTTITLGTDQLIGPDTNDYQPSVIALNSSTILVGYQNGSTYPCAIACSVSAAGVITPGTGLQLDTTAANGAISFSLCPNGNVLASWVTASSYTSKAIMLGVAGTALSNGAIQSLSGLGGVNQASVSLAFSNTQAVVITGNSSGYMTAMPVTMNGLTLTPGTAGAFASASASNFSGCMVDGNKGFVSFLDVNSYLSGILVGFSPGSAGGTQGTPSQNLAKYSTNSSLMSAAVASATKTVIGCGNGNVTAYVTVVDVSTGALTATTLTPISGGDTAYNCAVGAYKGGGLGLAAWYDNTATVMQLNVLEIGQ